MAAESQWTFEKEVTLRRMWSEGHSARVIGEALGMSRCAVLGKRFRLQLPFPLGGFQKVPRPYKRRDVVRKAPKPKPVPPSVLMPAKPVQPVTYPKPRWLTLNELGPRHCRWPEGNGPFVFCGADIDEGPYCARHVIEARPPPRIRKTAA